ncbi:MAG: carboxypeptidase regulatory-like domain-containing protein, partial [Chloroflexota bacterium]
LALRQSDHSNARGYWAIGDLPDGSYRLIAEAPYNRPELVSPRAISVTIPGASNPYTLTFNLAPKVVTGQVTSNLNGGTPVENALIVARRVDRSGAAQTLSDGAGNYSLRLSAGLWALTVKETDTTSPANWVYPKSPQLVYFEHDTSAEEKNKSFRVFNADASVSGIITLPDGGTPPFTVTVGIFNNEGIGRRVQTDLSDGSFSIRVPHGGYKVVVHPHSRFYLGPKMDPIRLAPDEALDLGTLALIDRDATISGTVLNSAGDGVAGIPVTAWRADSPDTLSTRTGDDGAYLLPVTSGRWHVQPAPGPRHPYIYVGDGQVVSLNAGEVISNVDFELVTADATIYGQLVDEATGEALGDIDGWARAVNKADTDLKKGAPIQAGTFSIYVPAGDYRVAAILGAGAPYMSGADRDVSVQAGETTTITLALKEKDGIIQGVLWDPRAEEIVTGVDGIVGAFSEGNMAGTSINKGNGTYRFAVAAGLWHLGYRIDPDDGYVKLIDRKRVPVSSGQSVEVPLPVVEKDGAIAGVVLGPEGNPRAGVSVFVHAVRDRVQGITLKTITNENGRFNLAVPHGLYRLGATGGGANLIKPIEKLVVVRPDQTVNGQVLQFALPDAVISGTLTISDTTSLTGTAFVWAWSDDGGFIKGLFPVTNSMGMYSLNVLSGTTWHLGAAFETNRAYWGVRTDVDVLSNLVI